MSDSPRLDRIEQIVISLEADMKIMASSVSSMAASMERFVEMQTDHKLLKQEMKHNGNTVHEKLRVLENEQGTIKEDIENCRTHCKKEIGSRFKEIELLVMLVRYPKVAIPAVVFLYLMTIEEVRNVILPFV